MGPDPLPGTPGVGVHGRAAVVGTCDARRAWLLDWFRRLRDRLRVVRVCCGHWDRVCSSESVTTRLGTTGVFLDPPYKTSLKGGKKNRSAKLYATDGAHTNSVVDEVIAWCLANGGRPGMRIAACGYEGEGYEALEAAGWRVIEWAADGGYGNRTAGGKANARRERLFASPHCLRDRTLFDQEPLP